ncbi:hypothetical protein D3C87_218190 [compost metagenome]
MAKNESHNKQANEAVSKYKLLSAYGGPGSLIHTEYGSIIVSCIEEWGFLSKINEHYQNSLQLKKEPEQNVKEMASLEGICFSNDERLLRELKKAKGTENLLFLALVPNIELDDHYHTIEDGRTYLAVNSQFLPKVFFDRSDHLKTYQQWYTLWGKEHEKFFPPKYRQSFQQNGDTIDRTLMLKQDNIVLLCKNGHISDFPWSSFLRWRMIQPHDLNNLVDLYNMPGCCDRPDIHIGETAANATGFDGKWIKCKTPGCECSRGVSLKGIMSIKIICPGHKPWESATGAPANYYGKTEVRSTHPRAEACRRKDTRIALTTGNNLYFSRTLSSIFMPPELFTDERELQIRNLEIELQQAIDNRQFGFCENIQKQIEALREDLSTDMPVADDNDREVKFRHQEYTALANRLVELINITRKDLLVNDVTDNLNELFRPYFHRILRVDRLKITSAQLDFSRVEPYEGSDSDIMKRNIFRSRPEEVLAYPVVENFGEGIFIAFRPEMIETWNTDLDRFGRLFRRRRNRFATGATAFGEAGNSQLYMVHTFSHLIMRELEFRCGYPTASLSERLFISNNEETKMYGCLIYTAEGAEGSMGGLIAQTREGNLNSLFRSALLRATICNSDPLCWKSEGQGLFELNLASCFACGLVSETSCEHRNIYLDRQVLIDPDNGFFKKIIPDLR